MPQTNPLIVLVMLGLLGSILATWVAVLLRFAFEKPILPPWTPRLVPWGAGSVLAAILVWLVMQVAVSGVYSLANRPPPGNAAAPVGKASLAPIEMMGLSAAGNLGAVVLIPLVLALTARARPRDFGLRGPDLAREAFRGVVAYPLLAPCVFGLMLVAVAIWGKSPHPLEDAMRNDQSPTTVAVLVFAGVIMAPLSEELLFRGVLLGWLTRLALGVPAPSKPAAESAWEQVANRDGLPEVAGTEGSFSAPIAVEAIDADEADPSRSPRVDTIATLPSDGVEPDHRVGLLLANVAVSTVFAVLHGPQWPAPVPLFVLSMGLGLLYQRTGSLVGPVTLHMTFNGISTLLMFLSTGTTPPADPKIPSPIPGPAIHRVEGAKVDFGRGRELTRDGSRL